METGREVVLSRGPWDRDTGGGRDTLELLFEDGTASPYIIHLKASPYDRLSTADDVGREWIFTAWVLTEGKPHEACRRPCWYRLAERITWLKPKA